VKQGDTDGRKMTSHGNKAHTYPIFSVTNLRSDGHVRTYPRKKKNCGVTDENMKDQARYEE
jgi:hypothetical protein